MAFNATKQTTTLHTKEGGKAYHITPMHEFYLLAASSLMSGDTFYETQDDRLVRFRALLDHIGQQKSGPAFTVAMAKWAREKLYFRTMPTLLATEALLRGWPDAEKAARWAWLRGDEHLEALAYLKVIGAKRTKRFLRAVADRLNRLTERQALRYAALTKSYTQRDAVAVSHPVPATAKQSALFKYLRHGWAKLTPEEQGLLPMVASNKSGEGVSWEQIISAKGSTPEAWTEAISVMGYMALLRNLRNVVEKGVVRESLALIAAKIADPNEIRAAHQLPYRYYSALKALPPGVPLLRDALSDAMNVAADALPRLDGETVVAVDLSPSMNDCLSAKSEVSRIEAVAPLAGALARQRGVETWGFSGSGMRANYYAPVVQTNADRGCCRIDIPADTPVLASMQMIAQAPCDRNGTFTEACLRRALKEGERCVNRVIVITDGQAHDNPGTFLTQYLDRHATVRAFVVDVAGLKEQPWNVTHPRLFQVGGFSDHVLDWITAMEVSDPVKMVLAYAAENAQ